MRTKDPLIVIEASLCADVANLLSSRLGFDTEILGQSFLEVVVRRAILESGLKDQQSWWRGVVARESLWQQLVDLVVVGETWMFRDPAAFGHIARAVLHKRARNECRPLRILSCPCSTGEEPFSVAITLLEAGLSAEEFAIDAIDVSARALAQAAQGRIGQRSFRGVAVPSGEYLTRDAGKGDWVVHARVQSSVKFQLGNLVSGEGLPASEQFDLILCRNLLIYLVPHARSVVLQRLANLLRPDGLLVVGHAEGLILAKAGFGVDGGPDCFAFRRLDPQRTSLSGMPACESLKFPRRPVVRDSFSPKPSTSFLGRQLSSVVQKLPLDVARVASISLEQIRAKADAGYTAIALVECQKHVLESPQSVAGYLLLAALNAARGDFVAAEDSLRRALYVDPNCVEALMHLAAIRADRGDSASAERLRIRAARLASTDEDSRQ